LNNISRRSILWGLIAAPVVIYANHLMPLRGIKLRQRSGWNMVLEDDGSTALVKDGRYSLDDWLQVQNKNDWGKKHKMWTLDGELYSTIEDPTLERVSIQIKDDKAKLQERLDHWNHLKAFQKEEGVKVEGSLYAPGVVFKGDVIPKPHKPFKFTTFQFWEKDWLAGSKWTDTFLG
jgi:hypothetical protein